MPGARELFLRSVDAVSPLLAMPVLAGRWSRPSALDGLTVAGLAGHLLRATSVVLVYLDRDEPSGPTTDAEDYYASVTVETDLDADIHRTIRQRGEAAGAIGAEAVLSQWRDAYTDLADRLPAEHPDRRVRVFRDHHMTLDGFLETRLVELCVHADDLAVSVGLGEWLMPVEAVAGSVDLLLRVCRRRHGDLAALRALARRERDRVGALRAL
jgi:hypothetical protein